MNTEVSQPTLSHGSQNLSTPIKYLLRWVRTKLPLHKAIRSASWLHRCQILCLFDQHFQYSSKDYGWLLLLSPFEGLLSCISHRKDRDREGGRKKGREKEEEGREGKREKSWVPFQNSQRKPAKIYFICWLNWAFMLLCFSMIYSNVSTPPDSFWIGGFFSM